MKEGTEVKESSDSGRGCRVAVSSPGVRWLPGTMTTAMHEYRERHNEMKTNLILRGQESLASEAIDDAES